MVRSATWDAERYAAAAVALLLLGNAWIGVLGGGDAASLMTQAGLAGSGLFVITVLAGELASRLAREELTAKDSMELARQQAQLNRLVIEEMQDGVLVVDRTGRVRAANPAARRLLVRRGLGRPAPFQLRGVPAWDQLVKTVERGFHEAAVAGGAGRGGAGQQREQPQGEREPQRRARAICVPVDGATGAHRCAASCRPGLRARAPDGCRASW